VTSFEGETIADERTRYTVASLSILMLILVMAGLLSHSTANENTKPVWKSASHGNPRDSGNVKTGQ
jgi:hypothetical protein